jgi:Protein of unknown function (DUF3795)
MEEVLVAPCGMNCSVCSAYLALTHDVKGRGIRMPYCAGCRPRNKQCAFLKKRCPSLLSEKIKYCYECQEFPCRRLRSIDQRYKTRYRMSLIENLEFIRENGIAEFLSREQEKWQCGLCSGVICCHNGLCFSCSLERLRQKKQKYRWDEP